MRLVNKILIGFFFAQAIEETCVVLFKCSPIPKSWDFLLEGSCIDLHPLFYVTVSNHGCSNYEVEVLTTCLPLFSLSLT